MSQPLRPTADEAVAGWRALVDADAEQVPRVREDGPAADYYAPIAARFRAGARATPEVEVLRALALPTDTWLDIGAGGGRLALPLAGLVRRVIAVDPSPAMRAQLQTATAEAGCDNIEVRDARWTESAWSETVDVAMAAHAVYDIAAIDAFLDAMERHATRMCVIALRPWARGAALASLFETIHGEPLHTLPAFNELVALLAARGRRYEVRTVPADAEPPVVPRDQAILEARRLLWLTEGSPKDQRMCALLDEWWGRPDGIALPRAPGYVGVVSWTPRPDGAWDW
ncbi:MAG: class I SAM-dependent methyltransferase [Dehalococcoidia bacterium]